MTTISELYVQAGDERLPADERDMALRQAEAAAHNACFYTGPSSLDREMRAAGRAVWCSPCGDEREVCGHPEVFGSDDPAWLRCERHGGRSQTECDVYEAVTAKDGTS